jgi:broad specificity phosphatase PhoE
VRSRSRQWVYAADPCDLRALIPLLLEEPRESSFRYDLANASVSVFGVEAKGFEVLGLNEVRHLEQRN